MSVAYHIDKEKGVVTTTYSGRLTDQDLLRDAERLREHPDFDPAFSHLLDFRGLKQFDVSSTTVRRIAQRSIFNPGVRKAIVAAGELIFGMSRMYELMARDLHQDVRVFRGMHEARAWLGLDVPPEDRS